MDDTTRLVLAVMTFLALLIAAVWWWGWKKP